MNKGYYLYSENCGSSGVMNKISMQIATFSSSLEIEGIQIKNSKQSLIKRIYNLMPWASFEREYEDVISHMQNPDFVYIRRMYIDRKYLAFLQSIRNNWSNCKIIVEQPVYPYEKDMLKTPYTAIHYIKELLFRSHYKDNIDRFVTYSDDEEILGVTTIRTMNGVNVDKVTPIAITKEYDPDDIKLIAVATLIPHHGYERIIEGLHLYYVGGGKRRITFDIVGDGSEKNKYLQLVEKYKLKDYVVFHGAMYGDDLERIYSDADAGLSAFGAYKEGVDKLCTIKAREYLAKGIPVILGCDDNLFLEDAYEYGLIYPNNDTAVDIERLAGYLDCLYKGHSKTEVSQQIRKTAYNTVDNKVTLRPVIEYIEG